VGRRTDVGGEGTGRVRVGRRRALATAAVVGAVLSPALRDHDSFPLSTYPVYASARASTITLSTAVGVVSDGRVVRLSPELIARSDDPLIAESLVDDAITADRGVTLCADIAARAPAGVVAIEVVQEHHDVAERGRGDTLLERVTHARCEVMG
jgi:hypothetical protein